MWVLISLMFGVKTDLGHDTLYGLTPAEMLNRSKASPYSYLSQKQHECFNHIAIISI